MKSVAKPKGTILLFCSDSDVMSVLRGALEDARYLVLPATDLDSAIDWLADCSPDLLIVLSYLNGISGHEAAQFLRTKCHGLPVLMIGGVPNDDRIIGRESLNEVQMFPKPFAVAEFLNEVVAAIVPRVAHEEGHSKAQA